MCEEVSQLTNADDPSIKHDMEQIHVMLKTISKIHSQHKVVLGCDMGLFVENNVNCPCFQ
jgi:hypothetical protein